MSRTEISPYLQDNKWACHCFMDSLGDARLPVRDKAQLRAHCKHTNQGISICTSSPNPTFLRALWTGTDDICTLSGLHYRKGTASFGNLTFLEWAVFMPVFCSKERFYCRCTREVVRAFIASEEDTISCHLLWKNTIPLASKAAFYTKILKKIILNKGKSLSCSQDLQKCKRTTENCLPQIAKLHFYTFLASGEFSH